MIGAVFLAIAGLGIWITSGEIDYNSSYHPFKSEKAREKFLTYYDQRSELWPVQAETKFVETSYGQTFVRISGPEDAEPLILLHGVSGNSLQWLSNIEALSEKYRVYAVDIIGDNGRSVYRKELKDASDYTTWLEEFFTELKLDKPLNMVGLSYGGWIASQYVLEYPKKINKLVLIAPVGTVQQLSAKWAVRAITVAIPLKYFTKNFMYWLAADTVESGDIGKRLIDEHIDEAYLSVRSFQSRKMVTPTLLSDEELGNLSIPTLFIVGENEKIFSAEEALTRLRTFALQIETRLVPNAGHDVTMVQAETVNTEILNFLNQ